MSEVTVKQATITYANEADIPNVTFLDHTDCKWRDANPYKDVNMRDYATLEQLLVLTNLENMSTEFTHMELVQDERLKRLCLIAIQQM